MNFLYKIYSFNNLSHIMVNVIRTIEYDLMFADCFTSLSKNVVSTLLYSIMRTT